jgi:glutathione synthase/RimK-type ligase-like ATP-grasp enzyme
MIVGIHNTWPRKPDYISDVYRAILRANNIEYLDLDSSEPDFWYKVATLDAFIYRWAHTDYHHQHAATIIPVIEQFYHKPCFPNWNTCWHYDDKIKQSLMLKAKGFPACDFKLFWTKTDAGSFIESYKDYPIVFKLKSGSGSMQVKLLKSRKEALHALEKSFSAGFSPDYYGIRNTLKTFNYDLYKTGRSLIKMIYLRYLSDRLNPQWIRQKNYFYVQKFYPGNDYDTRVQITGKRAFAFIRYNRPNDFRASGSNNWSLDRDKIDMEFVKIAFNISKTFGFQSMAYDFIYDENRKPAIVEISYCFGDYPEFSNGYWDESLVWHEGRFLPQYFELVDLLDKTSLVLPDYVKPSSSYKDVSTEKSK